MKKTIVSVMFWAMIAINSRTFVRYMFFNNNRSTDVNLSNLYPDECEALAGCEVYDSNHNLIVNCEEDEGACYKISDNLYCLGKKVNRKFL